MAKKPLSLMQSFFKEVKEYSQIILVAFFITTFLFTTTAVAGSSMHPNLNGGVVSIQSPIDMLKAALIGDRLFVPKYET